MHTLAFVTTKSPLIPLTRNKRSKLPLVFSLINNEKMCRINIPILARFTQVYCFLNKKKVQGQLNTLFRDNKVPCLGFYENQSYKMVS